MTTKKEMTWNKIILLNLLAFLPLGTIIGASITYGVRKNTIDVLQNQVAVNTPKIAEMEIKMAKYDIFFEQNNKDHAAMIRLLERMEDKKITAIPEGLDKVQ